MRKGEWGVLSYRDKLIKHLAEYKRVRLGIREPGIFRYQGRDLPCHHILPVALASRNLFEEAEPVASAFLLANPGKRHRYFHHLNSSQAFYFNLFFPYFAGPPEAASALLRALGQEGLISKWQPEAVPEPEEGSKIDVMWTTSDGRRTFCEVKLTESSFGKANDDASHRAKLSMYRSELAMHLESPRLERKDFFGAYQFYRNVWHLVRIDGSRLIFLLPRSNAALWTLLHDLMLGVTPHTRKRISGIAIEDALTALSSDLYCPERLREYATKLMEKYVV